MGRFGGGFPQRASVEGTVKRISALTKCRLLLLSRFEHPLRYPQSFQRPFLYLTAYSSSYEDAGESAQAVRAAAIDGDQPETGAAGRVGHQRAYLETGPEVVARVQHLGRNDSIVRPLTDRQVTDANRGLQAELRFLPVQEVGCTW